jgi:4-amino-4-deoxy-L-arabinose transferase-like glycosyltransferase
LVWQEGLLLVILAFAVYYSLFHSLGDAPLTLWDEARYANNAIDFLENPHFFKVTHLGQADEFNTKPGLVIWLQAACMWLFGINELAVRLPSAVFGLLTLGLVYLFAWRFFQSRLAAWLSAALLLCSPGFMSGHNVRTGDLDATLVFWLFLGLFVTVDLLVKQPLKTRKHFLLLALSVLGGFLTKGIAGFFFVPFLLLVPVFLGRFAVFRDKNLYFTGLLVLTICAAYYLLRDYYMPGYLALVAKYEWSRYTEVVMSWQKHPFFWYLSQMAAVRFFPFIYFLPICFIGLFTFKEQERTAFLGLLFPALGYLLLISYPEVKLLWYDAPLYPLLVLLLGICLAKWVEHWVKRWRIPFGKSLFALILVLLLIQPYRKTLALMLLEDGGIYNLVAEGAYLRDLRESKPEWKTLTVYKVETHAAHYDQLLFYIRRYNQEEGCQIRLTQEPNFAENEIVLLSKPEYIGILSQNYKLRELDRSAYGALFQLTAK